MRIAFHSYKGGVGRTKIMVGVGALMAMRGCRVGMLDFDLDSPGLAGLFGSLDTERNRKPELLKILHDGTEVDVPDAFVDVDHVLEQRFGESPPAPGRLRFIPTIANPHMSELIQLSAKRVFLNELLRTVDDSCGVDYLLIDLRPGLSAAFREVVDFVDKAVVVSRIDCENIIGLRQVLPALEDKHPILVANMIPDSPKSARFIDKLEQAGGVPVAVRIPLDGELMFDRDIECVADPGSGFRQGLERIADQILQF